MSDKNKEEETKILNPDIVFHTELKVVKSDGDEDKKDFMIEGFASTEDLDRGNDVTHAEAFQKTLKEFMQNPMLLFMHDLKRPIGRIVEASIEKGKGLFVKAFISETEPDIRKKIEEGILKAFSFGFFIKKSDEEENDKQTIRHLRDVEMFEISVVSIPMNRRALFSMAKAFETGTDLVYQDEYVDSLKENIERLGKDVDQLNNAVSEIDELKKEIKEKMKMYEEKQDTSKENDNKGLPENKTVIPFKDYGLASEDTVWNGPKEVAASDVDTLRKIATWFKSPGDTKDDFKLPHHRQSDLKLVLRGLQAAGAAVQGARGGVDIPASDMPRVRAHLGRHFKQFNKTPPWEKSIGIEFDSIAKKLNHKEYVLDGDKYGEPEHIKMIERKEELEELILKDLEIDPDEKYTDIESVDDIEGKAGRVLSGKNRDLVSKTVSNIETAMETMNDSLEALKGLLQAVNPNGKSDEPEKPVVKHDIGRVIVNELSDLDGYISIDNTNNVEN